MPFRGIQPFRYVDHAIFLARDDETDELDDLVAIYRGVLLYGASGDGKSSLVNAGLLPAVARRRLRPERLRVQPRQDEEIVVERIATTEDERSYLPSLLAPRRDDSARFVMSARAFEQRVREACASGDRPLLIFDQFEELITLFEGPHAVGVQDRVAAMLIRLLCEPLAVKLVFVFREDYLSKVKRLLAAAPELVDQTLQLEPLSADRLPTIVRGPFERRPGHFSHELDPALSEQLCAQLTERFGDVEVSLSEVETVALRLWQSDDPHALLTTRGVQGLLEDDLAEALDGFATDERAAATALLAQLVTRAGTRNVVSAEDLVERARDDDPGLSPALLSRALERLEQRSRLVRRESRGDIRFYEITSEFLVPWISRRREELRRERERASDRRRFARVTAALLVFATVVAGIAIGLGQRAEARRQASHATALVLASASTSATGTRPDIAALLGLAAYQEQPSVEARSALIGAISAAREDPGVRAILHGHSAGVRAVAFSRQGILASASDDGTVRLWSPRTHRQLGAPLDDGLGMVTSVAWSPDGRTLASGDDGGTIRLWDPRTHRQIGTALNRPDAPVLSVAFDRSGRTLAAGARDGAIALWDSRTHRQVGTLRSPGSGVDDVAFSPDGRMLAAGGDDGRVRLWDPRTQRQLGSLAGHSDAVTGVAFSPNGRILASASADRTIVLWNPRTRRRLGKALAARGRILDVAFSPNGRILASAGDDHAVELWDPTSHRRLGEPLAGHAQAVNGVAFSPDGRILASASDDDTIRLWDPARHEQLDGEPGLDVPPVGNVALAPDARTLASARMDKTIRLLDVRTGRRIGTPLVGHTAPVGAVAFSPDGRTLASGSDDHTVRVWDVRTHRLRATLAVHATAVLSVAFSPDGQTLASADDQGTISLWSAGSPAQLSRPLHAGSGRVNTLAFGDHGRILAAAGDDGTIRLWDPRTRTQRGRLRIDVAHAASVTSVAFSSDGRTLASGDVNGTIRLWDPRTETQTGIALNGHVGFVEDVQFSPDGRTLASAGDDGTSRLWDPHAHKPLGTPLRAHGTVVEVAFGRDGRTLVSATADGAIRSWDGLLWHDAGELRADVCSLVGGGLNHAEWTQFAGGIAYRQTCR